MAKETPINRSHADKAIGELAQLGHFAGPPKDFWPLFMAAVQQLTAADKLCLLARKAGQPWRRVLDWPAESPPSRMLTEFFARLDECATLTAQNGRLTLPLDRGAGASGGNFIVAAIMTLPQQQEECVLAGLISELSEAAAREASLRLGLAVSIVETYQTNLAARQARNDVEKFAVVLGLITPVNEATRFLPAALAFCNEITTRFHCERASLGWIEGGYIHLQAMSRTEHFDRRMAAAQALETAMEECADQDDEIVWPAPENANAVTRDHENFASNQKVAHVCSVPLRVEGNPVAVLTCERQASAFTTIEIQQLRLSCDQVVRRLDDLKRLDRWFGARWAAMLRERCASLLGPEHTWSKVAGLATAALLAVLFLVRVNYRVEGNFILRSDAAEYLTAPFDGYIEQVFVRAGDPVSQGGSLVALNRNELLLEQSAALADIARYQRESEKARAANTLAEMRIADALQQQAKSRADLVRYRLENAVIKSTFDGVVVEGDLRERIGAPVKQGEALFKIARLDSLYAEAEVNERDIKEILGRSQGEISFVTQPKFKYPVTMETIEPAAVPKKDGNFFLVRLKLSRAPEAWWRPGMTGLCKLSVERRSLFWVLTHRTVDFLRMKLWW